VGLDDAPDAEAAKGTADAVGRTPVAQGDTAASDRSGNLVSARDGALLVALVSRRCGRTIGKVDRMST
jgi:hypothetical protein